MPFVVTTAILGLCVAAGCTAIEFATGADSSQLTTWSTQLQQFIEDFARQALAAFLL